ncbi:uncharacterized protein [Haliotis asinina]|uniref:uncharacterized protein n=1 Tax=Haliotis asinina TaxID=109174 RepID=UPI0035326CEA
MLRTISYRKKILTTFVLVVVTLLVGKHLFLKRQYTYPVRKHGNAPEAKFKYFYGPSRVPVTSEKDFPKPKYDKKYFIYDCSQRLCGGLGDRQEGILAAYLISQLMGRQFGVVLTIPCDITNFLDENDDKWMIPPGALTDLTVLPYKVLDEGAWKLRETIHTMELENRFTQDVIFFNVNQEFVKYLMKLPRFRDLKWAQNKTAVDIYNIVLRRLFKLKPKYQEKLDNFQNSVRANGRKLVCAHIRLYRTATEDKDYVDKMFAFLRQYNDSAIYRMFVATNSETVKEQSRRMFPKVVVDIDGPIVHVDLDTGAKACEGFGKALLDQQILSTCDIFLMSYSGFGRVAAMLRGTDENLYSLEGKVSFKDTNFLPPRW